MTAPAATAAAELRARWTALLVLCAGQLMIILDGTIVTVALPTIQADLGFTPAGLAWVVNAYLIAFGGLLLLAGRFGDLAGRRRIFQLGLAVFTTASLLCGVAGTPELLIAARFVQGAGGALTSAVVLGMIIALFPERGARAKAIGVYSFVGAGGASLGVLAGGVLTQLLSWHWVFFINLPIGVVAAVFARRLLAADRGHGPRAGMDALGALLVTSALMLGVYTIVEVEKYGWGSAHTIGFGALSAGLLAGFVLRQAKAANPLLPLRIFRSRRLSGANLTLLLMVAGMLSFQFLIALYLGEVLGYDAVRTGLAMLPIALVIALFSLGFAARLSGRFGNRAVLLTGLVLILAGQLLLTGLPAQDGYLAVVLPAMVLLGIGFGLAMPPLTVLAMSAANPADAGVASGLFNTTLQVGGAIGVAVLATVAAGRANGLAGSGAAAGAALTGGYRLAFVVAAAFIVAAIAVAATTLRETTASGDQPMAAASSASER
ncbi:MFS transporter [Amycolatopsis nigrescens]|uniref:MFS transporter n=1 Tax=Amycolatopsis nigrescens TaxID=381445 RepID=UPI00035F7512|nr:MFS transporter [Amycolatopsis nigrescens]